MPTDANIRQGLTFDELHKENEDKSEHYNIIFKDDQLTDDYTEYFSRNSIENSFTETKTFEEDNSKPAKHKNKTRRHNSSNVKVTDDNNKSKERESSVKLKSKTTKSKKVSWNKRKRQNKILFNCVNTKYPLIKEVGKILGWKYTSYDNDHWDVMWTDLCLPQERLAKMKTYQKI